jgi:hypothetical protein
MVGGRVNRPSGCSAERRIGRKTRRRPCQLGRGAAARFNAWSLPFYRDLPDQRRHSPYPVPASASEIMAAMNAKRVPSSFPPDPVPVLGRVPTEGNGLGEGLGSGDGDGEALGLGLRLGDADGDGLGDGVVGAIKYWRTLFPGVSVVVMQAPLAAWFVPPEDRSGRGRAVNPLGRTSHTV